jgi:uridylate kinase
MLSKKHYILSLGGSLIVPNGGINIKFLKYFEKYIRKKVAQSCRFFIVTGGGATARHYIKGATKICDSSLTDDDRDWLGIHATRINAHLLRTIFRDIAYHIVIKDLDVVDKKAIKFPVTIAAGWKPGWSTDYDSVVLAQDYNINTLINLTSIKMVYDKDPKKFKDAKPIKKLSWDEILDITGKKFTPGMNVPFDPIASKLAKKIGLKVIVCNGRDLDNLDNIIEGKGFVGTVVK